MYNRRFSVLYLLGCNKENQLNEIKCHLLRISVCGDFITVMIFQEEQLNLVDFGDSGLLVGGGFLFVCFFLF